MRVTELLSSSSRANTDRRRFHRAAHRYADAIAKANAGVSDGPNNRNPQQEVKARDLAARAKTKASQNYVETMLDIHEEADFSVS